MKLFGITRDNNRLLPNHIGNFEFIDSYTTSNKWDVLVLHRMSFNEDDANNSLKEILNQYSDKIHDKTELWIETTCESGNLRSFLNGISDINIDRDITFVIDAELPNDFQKNSRYKYVLGYELNFYGYFSRLSDAEIHISSAEYFSRDVFEHRIKNGYQSLNGSFRIERLKLFAHFIENNLTFDNSSFYFYANYSGNGWEYRRDDIVQYVTSNEKITETEKNNILSNIDMLPIGLDTDDDYLVGLSQEGELLARNSLNVVLENVSNFEYDPNIITFTEKSIKPFFHGQLGLIFGIPNSMKKLEELGLDIYRDFIDYEYDNIADPQLRWDLFTKEFDRLRKLDTKSFLRDNMGRVMHNKTHCTRISNSGFEKIDKLVSKYRK